jgi:hypothetical protein
MCFLCFKGYSRRKLWSRCESPINQQCRPVVSCSTAACQPRSRTRSSRPSLGFATPATTNSVLVAQQSQQGGPTSGTNRRTWHTHPSATEPVGTPQVAQQVTAQRPAGRTCPGATEQASKRLLSLLLLLAACSRGAIILNQSSLSRRDSSQTDCLVLREPSSLAWEVRVR